MQKKGMKAEAVNLHVISPAKEQTPTLLCEHTWTECGMASFGHP